MIDSDFTKRFLTETDDTGRFIVKSLVTGRTYYVEPIEGGKKEKWGDLQPGTGKMSGGYGEKYRGAVREADSMITPDAGFEHIHTLNPGESPIDFIDRLDKKYAEKTDKK